jgi:hypothetical protein
MNLFFPKQGPKGQHVKAQGVSPVIRIEGFIKGLKARYVLS